MIVEKIENRIQALFENEGTGHDWYHIERVLKMSEFLQSNEGGDLEIIQLAALLHDISDHKFNGGDLKKGGLLAIEMLKEEGFSDEKKLKQIQFIIDHLSFKGGLETVKFESIEGKIVQDADRLDALGSIGIGRTFAYGGHKKNPMYDPRIPVITADNYEEFKNAKSTTINHFYEKLLLLKDQMNTQTGLKIAEKRHQKMERFLSDFMDEWNLNDINE